MSYQVPDRFDYDPIMHEFVDRKSGTRIPYNVMCPPAKEKPVRKLSIEEQKNLLWIWHDDPNLALIYRTFERFVESRVGKFVRDEDI